MRIYEIEHKLTDDDRNTLLFLTGGLKLIKSKDCTKEEIWNLQEFFGFNHTNKHIIKIIIFRDKVVTKIKEIT
jgi:hypothetical protein